MSLTDGLRGGPGKPDQAPQAQPQTVPEGDGLVPVYLTNATRCSGGIGPGVVRVPTDEANRLINDKRGIAGERPPRGFLDGGGSGLHAG